MSSEEKGTWVYLVAVLVTYGAYVAVILGRIGRHANQRGSVRLRPAVVDRCLDRRVDRWAHPGRGRQRGRVTRSKPRQ